MRGYYFFAKQKGLGGEVYPDKLQTVSGSPNGVTREEIAQQ